MEVHPDEVAFARLYSAQAAFEGLSADQLARIRERGRVLHRWSARHHALHCTINVLVISLLLGVDFLLLLQVPSLFSLTPSEERLGVIVLASLLIGGLRSWLAYSLAVFSIHEGAAHGLIFPPRGPVTGFLNRLANNLCRLSGADPLYYAAHHRSHHSRFGTAEDGEFLNFVERRRFAMAFLPFAMFVNFSDFIVHRSLSCSKSQVVSLVASVAYNAAYGVLMVPRFGTAFTLLLLVVFHPHLGFYIDRLRQFSEHNLMPLDNKDGARSFGVGFWGLLIGGGPWGQPCHWMHHLMPGLTWYQQIALHRHAVRLLSPAQRRQYLLPPVIGYPRLIWRLWTEPKAFVDRMSPARR
jgi:hypothetical protein